TVAFSREVISCSETMMDEHITTEENQGSNLTGPFLPGQSRTFTHQKYELRKIPFSRLR
ncbi:hypothetical protein, partial [Escherichia coli]|uniref:hypothetical protein n=1 Tax=Escherichia coli TaxID=562 RepID=UPI00207C1904